ncbi:hypothetical protein CC99x_002555 [Candidatus Berkiella cookevillensis]|uniref:Uncharacterized protein n=1 Tax=Candidatus Berkiella cookevillensis TaxID=437022 RepID=A0A0Q9YHL6_9GAMM|nr:hypothetical protein [Candidatus Berkiella cookevillensis]MCS5707780.1 hypothetical protein [Candidatus Berkiella cookevillensis]
MPYFNLHSFRNTLAALDESLCQSAEEFKAWSQNLGYEGVLTTFYSYGEVQESRQTDILKQLKQPRANKMNTNGVAELAKAIAKEMANQST